MGHEECLAGGQRPGGTGEPVEGKDIVGTGSAAPLQWEEKKQENQTRTGLRSDMSREPN